MGWKSEQTRQQRLLAKNVRRLRDENGWSLETAEAASSLGARHWQSIEAADANVTMETLAKLAVALGVSIVDLLTPPKR